MDTICDKHDLVYEGIYCPFCTMEKENTELREQVKDLKLTIDKLCEEMSDMQHGEYDERR